MNGMAKSVGGGGESVWPNPIGKEASEVTDAFEAIRKLSRALSQWCLDEVSANNLEAKIMAGMASQARIQPEAAAAVAREIIRLVRMMQDHAEGLSSVAKLAGTKMVTMYEEPIREARSRRPGTTALGLKVN